MSLRRKVAKLLAEGRLDDIAALSDEYINVVSAVVSRLYEADALARFRAADALGRVSARIMQRDRGPIDQLLKKLSWSLNEESGATAWGAPHAIGEVARCDAGWAADYYPLLISYLDHDETYLETDILVHGVVYALGRVGERFPELGETAVDRLVPRLRDNDVMTRGLAIWALGCIGDGKAKEPLLELADDSTEVERYVDGDMESTTLGTLAQAALESLRA